MKKIALYLLLMFLLANSANAEKYFVLDVNYIIGSVTFNGISLKETDRAVKYDNSGFLVKTVSFDSSDIEKAYYNMSENKKYLLYIPYDENAARIEVYNLKSSKIMDIDVASFADTCSNSICEAHESYESCTKDCSSGGQDDFCDELKDGICDPDCSAKTDIDCQSVEVNGNASIVAKPRTEEETFGEIEDQKKPNYLLWISLVLAIIIIVAVILFIKNRKENQTITSLKQYISENIRKGFSLQQIKDVLYREGYSDKEIDKAVRSI
ncbi:hypothetical protein HY487_01150 [Candidatus Woesearchaeota archaeon]|nr:hypothetical protein [Candidatus Woesearchaeota archaeon]